MPALIQASSVPFHRAGPSPARAVLVHHQGACHAGVRNPFLASAPRHGRVVPAGLLALALTAATATAQTPTHPLNDTGQVTCYNASAATGTVSPGTPAPEATGFKGQDCTQGRAAADALGTLVKVGASSTKGRDYTKIANDGSVLPASATLGPNPGDWACTRDNVTGLIWEVKVNNATHLRHSGHRYTWYDTNGVINGGNAGTVGNTSTCANTLGGQPCNTSNFRNAVNALTGANRLCGATDWRLPTANELQSLVDYQAQNPAIDTTWFPNTPAALYWSGENYVPGAPYAWVVDFYGGGLGANGKDNGRQVRLVRGGQ